MPQLHWDSYEFIECLGVLPNDDGYGAKLHYLVEHDELALEVTVWQYESVVELHLRSAKSGNTITRLFLVIPTQIQYERSAHAEYLLFKNVAVSPSRFFYNDLSCNPFNPNEFKAGVNVRLSIKPSISILFVRPNE